MAHKPTQAHKGTQLYNISLYPFKDFTNPTS
jgi:hypothetical protein